MQSYGSFYLVLVFTFILQFTMSFQDVIETKQRIIQEFVPGKQITIAHVIANPKPELFKKMGLEEKGRNAIGILTITPGEGTIIAADIASKAAGIEIGFVDRFSGALLITGDVSAVESSLRSVIEGLERILGFYPTELTRT